MQFTIFKTPVIRTVFRIVARFLLRLNGWKLEGRFPRDGRCVAIAAPHTSNWDFYYGLLLVLASGVDTYWMGKASLFKFPFGGIMKWLGGIPIDRGKNNDMVAQAVEKFRIHENLSITIPPEGSRSAVQYWKSGFYFIAHKAQVPVLLGYIDYARKVAGFGPLFYPAGDIDCDMEKIRHFYRNIRGKHPEKETEARISPRHYKREIS